MVQRHLLVCTEQECLCNFHIPQSCLCDTRVSQETKSAQTHSTTVLHSPRAMSVLVSEETLLAHFMVWCSFEKLGTTSNCVPSSASPLCILLDTVDLAVMGPRVLRCLTACMVLLRVSASCDASSSLCGAMNGDDIDPLQRAQAYFVLKQV